MEQSKSEQCSVYDFSNPNIAAIFPPTEDRNLIDSDPLVYDSDISEKLDHEMENCALDILDDLDTSFYSDLSRISLNDNLTFLNGPHNNTYKNPVDNGKYLDCNTSKSRVHHSSELDYYPNSIRAQMRRVEEDKYVDCNAASCSRARHSSKIDHRSHAIKVKMQRAVEDTYVNCNTEASCSGVHHPYELDRNANAIKVQMQRVAEEKYKLEKIIKASNSSSVCYMQHYPRSTGDTNLYCSEAFQNQLFMSRSNGMNLVKPLRLSSLPNDASKNFINTQVNMLNKFNASTSSTQGKYTSMDYVEGRIYHLAKDPRGCRFLQRKFAECSLNDFNKVFCEIINHVVELMTDPFGSYLMHTMIELCNINQRSQIVHELTKERGSLIEISCNGHGTRLVRKLIETLETNEQIYRIISALDIGVIYLMENANGSRVLQSCLKHFTPEQNEFILEAALSHCVEIATHGHGCCFLQRCITSFSLCQKTRLITQILHYVFPLSEDRFGNYVVQCVLGLGIPWVTAAILAKLKGKYAHLLMKKHSSYVVEKCMECAKEDQFVEIIQEIMESPLFLCVLEDEFGNFAIQRALERTKGALRASLMASIEHYAPELQNHPFGKNVLLSIQNGSSRSRSSIRHRNRCRIF